MVIAFTTNKKSKAAYCLKLNYFTKSEKIFQVVYFKLITADPIFLSLKSFEIDDVGGK